MASKTWGTVQWVKTVSTILRSRKSLACGGNQIMPPWNVLLWHKGLFFEMKAFEKQQTQGKLCIHLLRVYDGGYTSLSASPPLPFQTRKKRTRITRNSLIASARGCVRLGLCNKSSNSLCLPFASIIYLTSRNLPVLEAIFFVSSLLQFIALC